MLLGKVKGSVTSTIKHASLKAQKILIIESLGKGVKGKVILALDSVQAGVGDTVLVNQEGGSARDILQDKNAPINHVVVGIVDSIFSKSS